jgi:hypothetical protein
MDIRHTRQFSEIGGEIRNPASTEDGKFLKYNDSSEKFDYSLVGEGDIDLTYFTTLIETTIGDTTDDYLESVTQAQVGSLNSAYWASFNMHNSADKLLKLGRLAWLDDFDVPTLPGDQKVLFDESNAIGGRSNFKYNYNTNKLLLDTVPLTFKSVAEGTYKEGIKYLGNYSFSFGGGIDSTKAGDYNLFAGYKAGHNLGASSSRNTIYGPNAGEFTASTLTGSVFLGGYAGRYETTNNKFYLDNTDYLDFATARSSSFLYGDLDVERRLYVRDSLALTKEIKIGDSGLDDAAGASLVASVGGSLVQIVDGGGGVYKPQYHNGTVWVDFAAGQNHYLQEISEDLGTEGLWHFIVKDSTGVTTIQDLTLQLPLLTDVDVPIAYTPSYPTIGASDYGYIQISNSSTAINNGFYYKSGFKWDNTLVELNIPGAIKMASRGLYSASNGVIRYDSALGHFYGRLAGAWKQLDNTDFDEITAINIGGATYELFKQKNSDGEIELRTVQSMSIDPLLNPNDRITFKYTADGDAILVGTTAERNRLSTTVDVPATDKMIDKDNVGETLHIRALRQGSGVVLTQTENYIQIDAVTEGGGGEVNTASNIGDIDLFYQKNGVDFEFFGLTTDDDRIVITQATSDLDPDNAFELDLEIKGSNETIVTSTTYSGNVFSTVTDAVTSDPVGTQTKPTLWFRPLISDTISITETVNDELQIELAGYVNNFANQGTGVEVYDETSVSPDYLFRTLTEGDHITLTQSATEILVDVDDITLTALGANPKLITQGVDKFVFSQKGITGTNGVTVTPSTNDIDFSIPNIEKFELSTGEFVRTIVYTGDSNAATPDGKIEFQLSHDDNINNGSPSYTDRTIAELNIGGGLRYDASTNTLWNDVPLGAGDVDYHLNEIEDVSTATDYVFNFHVEDDLGNPTSESPLTLTIPKPVAEDFNALLDVDLSERTHTTGSYNLMSLAEVTRTVGFAQDPVLFEPQNLLHDADNSGGENVKRSQARANIGSAYINGKSTEDFNTKDLTATGVITASSSSTHRIGAVNVTGSTINGQSTLTLKPNAAASTSIVETGTSIIMTVDTTSGTKAVIIRNESNVPMFKFDVSTGNLYVKGKIYADDDIEAFTDDATV